MLLLAFFLYATTLIDRVVAVYDMEVVTLSEVQDYRAFIGPSESERSDREIIRDIILRRLKLKEIAAVGNVHVSAEEVEQALREIQANTLENHERNPIVLKQLIRENLLIKRYVEKRFMPQIFITDDEREALYHADFPSSADHPMSKKVRKQIDELIQVKKLNDLIESWNRELMTRTRIRFLYDRASSLKTPDPRIASSPGRE